MKTIEFVCCVLLITLLRSEENAGNPRLFNSAAHYWPLNRPHGILDIKNNVTGVKHGKIENIHYKGPGNGFLHTNGKAWVDLGNFTGSCLAGPAKCKVALTVFLWLKYSPNKHRRYLLGTSSHLTFSEGFTIYKDSDKRANNSIVVRVNDGEREWTGYLTLKPEVWSHVMFTWDYKSGLALFQNCNQMALVSYSKLKATARSNRSNVLEHHLSLAGAQKIQPEMGVKASYEDLAVFYRKMASHERNWICLHKLEEPQINSTCKGSMRWLSITWRPPPMTYDILTGYNVWYWGDSFSNWTKLSLGSKITTLNFTNLDPGSSYIFRVQNAFRFGVGKSSQMIECTTKTEVLDPPLNLTVEMKSAISVLLKWIAPPNSHEDVTGYKITYSVVDSDKKPITIKAGPMTSFLLDGLQNDTEYIVQVARYGDKRFRDSAPAVTTVKTDNDDKSSVKEKQLEIARHQALRVKWKKPRDKYKVFSYRAFVKWKDFDGIQNSLEVYDGNATSCVYSIEHIPYSHTFHVMAYVVRQIPLVPVLDPPMNVTIVSISWSHVILNWTSPFHGKDIDFADLYRLNVTSNKDKITVTATGTHARINGLKQLTDYVLNAQAWNGLGYGPALVTDIHFRTPDHDECADDSHMCHVNAVCANTEGSYKCECELGYTGDGRNCEDIPEGLSDDYFCPEENFAGIQWRRTLVNRKEVTACPEGTVGVASRHCTGSPAKWELPDLGDCVSKWMSDLSNQLNNPNVSVSLVANQLAKMTDVKSGKPLYAGDLKLLVDVIGVLSQRGLETSKNKSADASKKFVKAVVGTASNILDNKNLQSWKYMPKDSQTEKASSLIDSLDVVALDMANSSQRNSTEMNNVVISVKSLENVRSENALLLSQQDEGEEAPINAVSFPASVLRGDSSTGSKPNFATLVSYKTIASLLTPRGEKSNGNDQQTARPSINSAIVSVNLRPLAKKTFKDPVVITLRHSVDSKGRKSKPSCVFLETDKNISWSDAGCEVSSTNTTHTVCHCYHLTSFAVLMSVKQDVSTLSKEHRLALTLITYVGVSISVVALCLAFLTFYFFRFSKSGRTFIHKNLSVALIFAQLLFMFGVNKTANELACKGIAIALHYFFLVAFAWMALEGVMLYLMLVKVFHTKTAPTKSKKIFFCLGWGLPIIVVVTSGVMFHEGYGTPAYCWLSLERGFIWSFVGPVLLVLMFNFVCLGITFNVMAKSGPSNNRKRTSRIRRWSKACMLLTCILGLTWMFGVFYINQESLFMAYFFTIFNTLQGLFIFLFHCVGDEKVRQEYRRVLCCHEEDKRYLLTKPSNSETSKSESSSRSMRGHVDNFKSKNQTLSSSADSSIGTIESKRNTFVVHVSDGQVRVRGVASDEHNRHLVRNLRHSGESFSSLEQPSGQQPDSDRLSVASAVSEEPENEQRQEENDQ
ncbi:uncharacterized protein LOC144639420 isoform X2 [Oculina patagonica]